MIFEFPQLKGSYGIGITKRHLIDEGRKESHNPEAQRELMAFIWYPANVDKNSLAPYRQDEIEETKTTLKQMGYPEQDLNDIDKIYSHAVVNANLLTKNAPYPVILFSHGYLSGMPKMYTAACEEVASHGYIVVSIAHTYFTASVTFPGGRIIKPVAEKYTQTRFPEEDLKTWIEDVKFVLDSLNKMNNDKNDQFYKSFDLDRIGMFGHSLGGTVAFELCLNDQRIKAGINLDGFIWGDTKANDLNKPFLFMLAQGSVDHFEAMTDEEVASKYSVDIEQQKETRKNFEKIYKHLKQTDLIKSVVIPNINHFGFTDFLLLKELPIYKNNKNISDYIAIAGSADGYKTMNLINEYIVGFFDKYIKNISINEKE